MKKYLKKYGVLIIFIIFFFMVFIQHQFIYLHHDDYGYASLSYAYVVDSAKGHDLHIGEIMEFLKCFKEKKEIKYRYLSNKKKKFFLQYNNSKKIEDLEKYIMENGIIDYNLPWAHSFDIIYGNKKFENIYSNIIKVEKELLTLEQPLKLEPQVLSPNFNLKSFEALILNGISSKSGSNLVAFILS